MEDIWPFFGVLGEQIFFWSKRRTYMVTLLYAKYTRYQKCLGLHVIEKTTRVKVYRYFLLHHCL